VPNIHRFKNRDKREPEMQKILFLQKEFGNDSRKQRQHIHALIEKVDVRKNPSENLKGSLKTIWNTK